MAPAVLRRLALSRGLVPSITTMLLEGHMWHRRQILFRAGHQRRADGLLHRFDLWRQPRHGRVEDDWIPGRPLQLSNYSSVRQWRPPGHAVRAVNRMVHERLLLLHFSREIRHAVPPAFSNSIRKDSSFCFLIHAHHAVNPSNRAL